MSVTYDGNDKSATGTLTTSEARQLSAMLLTEAEKAEREARQHQ